MLAGESVTESIATEAWQLPRFSGSLPTYRARGLTARATRLAARTGSSCSHTRTTRHPAARRRRVVSASRLRFASILARHHSRFTFGHVACFEHPCQKHPSTNTASRARAKVRSARRRVPGTPWSTRKRRPRLCRTDRSASSQGVSRRSVAFIRRRTAADDASGRFTVRRRRFVGPFELQVVALIVGALHV